MIHPRDYFDSHYSMPHHLFRIAVYVGVGALIVFGVNKIACGQEFTLKPMRGLVTFKTSDSTDVFVDWVPILNDSLIQFSLTYNDNQGNSYNSIFIYKYDALSALQNNLIDMMKYVDKDRVLARKLMPEPVFKLYSIDTPTKYQPMVPIKYQPMTLRDTLVYHGVDSMLLVLHGHGHSLRLYTPEVIGIELVIPVDSLMKWNTERDAKHVLSILKKATIVVVTSIIIVGFCLFMYGRLRK
jgi:hypothetical protein